MNLGDWDKEVSKSFARFLEQTVVRDIMNLIDWNKKTSESFVVFILQVMSYRGILQPTIRMQAIIMTRVWLFCWRWRVYGKIFWDLPAFLEVMKDSEFRKKVVRIAIQDWLVEEHVVLHEWILRLASRKHGLNYDVLEKNIAAARELM